MDDELISREAALDVLDILIADSKRIAGDNKLVQKAVNIQRGMRAIVVNLPAVDAVEVVRCKDCRQWQRHTQINRDYGGCRRHGSTMFFGDFCSYGERRKENAAD